MGEGVFNEMVTRFGKTVRLAGTLSPSLLSPKKINHSVQSPYLFQVANISSNLLLFIAMKVVALTQGETYIQKTVFQDLTFRSYNVNRMLYFSG